MMAVVAVLLFVAVWEWVSFHGGWKQRGAPVPQRLTERAQRRMREYEEQNSAGGQP